MVALIALAVMEITSLPRPIETAAVVGAVLAVSGLLRYGDRVRAAIEG